MSVERESIAAEQAERLRAVGELSPECFRQLAENVSDVFYILDLQSPRMMYVSPAYEKLWARPVGSLYAQPDSWLSVVHPELYVRAHEQSRGLQQLAGVLAAGGLFRVTKDAAGSLTITKVE